MRIDDFLSTVGAVKRRTVAKEMGDNGLLHVNGKAVKPSYDIKVNDIIRIRGSRPETLEVLAIPKGSVSKEQRSQFLRTLTDSPS